MLPVIVSVILSSLVTAALLVLTRQRLARQFEDIQRRLGQLERTVAELKLDRERTTVPAQLQRLHLGMVRIHDVVARRFGSLREAAGIAGEYRLASLGHWARALGVTASPEEIARVCESVGSAAKAGAPDGEAAVLALFRWRGERLVVGNAAPLERVLASLAPVVFREVGLASPIAPAEANAWFLSADELAAEPLPDLAPGAWLIVRGPEDEAGAAPAEIPGYRLVASEWGVSVHERRSSS